MVKWNSVFLICILSLVLSSLAIPLIHSFVPDTKFQVDTFSIRFIDHNRQAVQTLDITSLLIQIFNLIWNTFSLITAIIASSPGGFVSFILKLYQAMSTIPPISFPLSFVPVLVPIFIAVSGIIYMYVLLKLISVAGPPNRIYLLSSISIQRFIKKIFFVLILIIFLAHPVQATWWNSSFSKERNITINNTVALTDFQLELNITYDSDMQSDFDDLRFTWYNSTSGNEQSMSYYLSSKVDSSWADVWIKIPELPASTNDINTVKMYYDNPTATSASNGDDTFLFFDDFSGTSYADKWTVAHGTWTESNGILQQTSTSAIGWIMSSQPDRGIITSSFTFPYNITIEAEERVDSYNYAAIGWDKTAGSNDNACGNEIRATSQIATGYANNWEGRENHATSRNTWYHITIKNIGTKVYYKINDFTYSYNGYNYSDQNMPAKDSPLTLFFYKTAASWDNITVRKYTSIIPVYLVGSEQTHVSAQTYLYHIPDNIHLNDKSDISLSFKTHISDSVNLKLVLIKIARYSPLFADSLNFKANIKNINHFLIQLKDKPILNLFITPLNRFSHIFIDSLNFNYIVFHLNHFTIDPIAHPLNFMDTINRITYINRGLNQQIIFQASFSRLYYSFRDSTQSIQLTDTLSILSSFLKEFGLSIEIAESINRTYVTLACVITNPTTQSPLSVTKGDVITVTFNVTDGNNIINDNLILTNITIGGVQCNST